MKKPAKIEAPAIPDVMVDEIPANNRAIANITPAMIILAAATFYKQGVVVDKLSQAANLLTPLVGNNAARMIIAELIAQPIPIESSVS